MKNKKGFTLIELLAVIVILGVIMVIAVPAVTKYITSSKKDTFVDTARMYIDSVQKQVADGEISVANGNSEKILLSTIDLQKGGTSPYGGKWDNRSYVLVTGLGDDDYSYKIFLMDENNNCIPETLLKSLSSSLVKVCGESDMPVDNTLVGKIKKNNSLVVASPTLTTSSYSANEKGLYKTIDSMYGGDTYYFRGLGVDNNVTFAGKNWSVIRINGDGSIRLILKNTVSTKFDTTYNKNGTYYSNSNTIKSAVDSWYIANLNSYSDKIVQNAKYCEQSKVIEKISVMNNKTAANEIEYSSYTPSFSCETDGNGKGLLTLNVGLINYDEAVYSGLYYNAPVNSNYIGTNSTFTMTPAGYNSSYGTAFEWCVDIDMMYMDTSYDFGIRPVINLKGDVTVTGSGSTADPYVVQ